MRTIQIFKNNVFGEIRTLMSEKGEPLFCAKDVCDALDYQNNRRAVEMHVDEDDVTKCYTVDSKGRRLLTDFINESGLYALVLSSRMPSAKAFKRWVTSEVLPQIRKTGGYIPTHDAEGRQLSDKEVMLLSNSIMRRTITQKNLPSDDCLTATEVAKSLGLGQEPKLLNKMLAERGIIRWAGGRYHLVKEYEDRGLTQVRVRSYYTTRTGEYREQGFLVWTKAGVNFIKDKLLTL